MGAGKCRRNGSFDYDPLKIRRRKDMQANCKDGQHSIRITSMAFGFRRLWQSSLSLNTVDLHWCSL